MDFLELVKQHRGKLTSVDVLERIRQDLPFDQLKIERLYVMFNTPKEARNFIVAHDPNLKDAISFTLDSSGLGDSLYYCLSLIRVNIVVCPSIGTYPYWLYLDYDEDGGLFVDSIGDKEGMIYYLKKAGLNNFTDMIEKYNSSVFHQMEMKDEMVLNHFLPLSIFSLPQLDILSKHDEFDFISACVRMEKLSKIQELHTLQVEYGVLTSNVEDDRLHSCEPYELTEDKYIVAYPETVWQNGKYVSGRIESFDMGKTMIFATMENQTITLSLRADTQISSAQTYAFDHEFRKQYGCPPEFDLDVELTYKDDEVANIQVKMNKS
jgi:hypothetical protein